ncbi:MAG: hypothetical protein EU521_01670, partial [Promethearchaeota archaeon]
LLDVSKTDDILNITENLLGIQATGAKEPYISLFVRSKDFSKPNLDKQLFINKNLAKIRGMRNTLFIVPKNLIIPISQATKSLRDNRFEGFFNYTDWEKEKYYELEKEILNLVAKEEFSASQIKKKLNSKKSLSLIISLMCDKLLLIRGPPVKSWKDNRSKYTHFKNYFPNLNFDEMDEQKSIIYLIKRYIENFGPVTENDIFWWIGLTKTKIKKALENIRNQIRTIKIKGLELDYLMLESNLNHLNNFEDLGDLTINLLPLLDAYLMSYKDRERFISPKDYQYVFDRSGNATSTILLEGKVIGIWDYEEKPPLVKIHLFDQFNQKIVNRIKKLCLSIGEFILEKKVGFTIIPEMQTLTKRKAGRFMHPLA